jgi:hypothetical protein
MKGCIAYENRLCKAVSSHQERAWSVIRGMPCVTYDGASNLTRGGIKLRSERR